MENFKNYEQGGVENVLPEKQSGGILTKLAEYKKALFLAVGLQLGAATACIEPLKKDPYSGLQFCYEYEECNVDRACAEKEGCDLNAGLDEVSKCLKAVHEQEKCKKPIEYYCVMNVCNSVPDYLKGKIRWEYANEAKKEEITSDSQDGGESSLPDSQESTPEIQKEEGKETIPEQSLEKTPELQTEINPEKTPEIQAEVKNEITPEVSVEQTPEQNPDTPQGPVCNEGRGPLILIPYLHNVNVEGPAPDFVSCHTDQSSSSLTPPEGCTNQHNKVNNSYVTIYELKKPYCSRFTGNFEGSVSAYIADGENTSIRFINKQGEAQLDDSTIKFSRTLFTDLSNRENSLLAATSTDITSNIKSTAFTYNYKNLPASEGGPQPYDSYHTNGSCNLTAQEKDGTAPNQNGTPAVGCKITATYKMK